jgi:hypothetical protein
LRECAIIFIFAELCELKVGIDNAVYDVIASPQGAAIQPKILDCFGFTPSQ